VPWSRLAFDRQDTNRDGVITRENEYRGVAAIEGSWSATALARAMRAHEKHRRIPVVMMTSLRAAQFVLIFRRGPHRCTYDPAARFR
jgi:hypothetical protein